MIRHSDCRSPAGRLSPAAGFTLIELLVTIAVAGVLLAIAGPALKDLMTQRAVIGQASELAEAMRFARSEAMKRGTPVTLCKLAAAPGAAATPRCAMAATTSWQYWAVFAERASDGTFGAIDPGEPVLRVQAQNAGKVAYGTDDPSSLRFITFQSTGIAVANAWSTVVASGSARALAITLSPVGPRGDAGAFKRHVRQVCLNAQGRAAVIDGTSICL